MQTRHTQESIKETTEIGFLGIYKASPNLIRLGSIIFSLSATTIILALIIYFKIHAYPFLVEIKSQIITFLPGILGFTIGGYSFLIGFNQASLMNKISEPQSDSPYSLYQVASASFAINLLIQSFTLLFGYAVHIIIQIDSLGKVSLNWNKYIINGFNYIGLFIIIALFILSLSMIIQIILNIYNFSQLYHYNVNIEKLDTKIKEDELKKADFRDVSTAHFEH